MRYCSMAFLLAALLARSLWATPCTYDTWEWDTLTKKSVNHRTVTKAKEELDAEEKGTVAGCTVCREDQEEVKIGTLAAVQVCRVFAPKIREALIKAMSDGFPIDTMIGYRVGKSKGPIDSKGRRTQFSNHSYGTAIDINAEKNGLYDNCVQFGPKCKLLRGGRYVAATSGAITPNSAIYRRLIEAGLKWGGEIEAKQKDFMHFSLSGM